jgi:hypothetical protein
MNQRIQLLAEQAGLVRRGDFGMKRWEGPLSDSINDQDLEKFAELLIFECTKVAIFKNDGMIATSDVAGHVAAGRSIAARMIREHFEVKE